MIKNDMFFVNIYPTNDRRQNIDYLGLLGEMVSPATLDFFSHTLLTVGDKRIDPWVIAQAGIQLEKSFSPIIAVNPFYMHPLEVAKKVISLHRLFPNPVSLNLVTGSFFNELKALNDHLTFDERSRRLKEFHFVLKSLLRGEKVSFNGQFYQLNDAEIFPKYAGEEIKFYVSGAFAKDFNQDETIHYVKNIKPLSEMGPAPFGNSGLAMGVCARSSREEAIREVKRLYPEDRRGEMLFEISSMNKETPWNLWLKENLSKHENNFDFYLNPIKNYWSSAPFLVDSYEGVAEKIRSYFDLGFRFFILDYLPDEVTHVRQVLSALKKNRP